MSCVLIETPMHINLETLEKIMTNKPVDPTVENEFKEQNLKYNLSKFEYDLYHEEDDVPEKIISVKRITLPNDGERWKVFENSKAMFVIEGTKLTKKEKTFLRTVDGVNFIIQRYKLGINSFNHFKTELKKKLK